MSTNNSRSSHRMGRIPNLIHSGDTQPLHSYAFRSGHYTARAISMTLIAILVFVITFAAAVYADLAHTTGSRAIHVVTAVNGKKKDILPLDQFEGKPINILLLGQDSRSGAENRAMGGTADEGEHNADTTMVLQISANRSYMNLVSIPRDTMVSVPACTTPKGTIPARSQVMFNSIFANGYQYDGISGAASCTMQAVTHLTGINLTAFAVVDFSGMRTMIDTLGGVDVCVPVDMSDDYTNLRLVKGWRHLNGVMGTQFARVRHGQGVGDGSDIMRTARQQYLIKQLIRQAESKSILTNSAELYQFAKAAINSVQMSSNLSNINTLMGLAASLRSFSVSHIYSRTAPIGAYPADPNRVQFTSEAEALWRLMRAGTPINKPLQSAQSSQADSSDQSDQSDQSGTSDQSNQSSEANSSDNSSADSSTTSSNSSKSDSSKSTKTVGGLERQADGTLIDPKTHGVVDPQTGFIRDANTGQNIGIADTYLNEVVCGVNTEGTK